MLILNNPVFYPFIVKKIKCSGNCNNTSDPYVFPMLLKT